MKNMQNTKSNEESSNKKQIHASFTQLALNKHSFLDEVEFDERGFRVGVRLGKFEEYAGGEKVYYPISFFLLDDSAELIGDGLSWLYFDPEIQLMVGMSSAKSESIFLHNSETFIPDYDGFDSYKYRKDLGLIQLNSLDKDLQELTKFCTKDLANQTKWLERDTIKHDSEKGILSGICNWGAMLYQKDLAKSIEGLDHVEYLEEQDLFMIKKRREVHGEDEGLYLCSTDLDWESSKFDSYTIDKEGTIHTHRLDELSD